MCRSPRRRTTHDGRVEGLDDRSGRGDRAHDDVAGQQHRDRRLGLQRLVRKLRPAGAEDHLWRDVDVELGLEGRLQVDLGEHAEARLGELLAHGRHRLLVGALVVIESV